MEEFHLEEKPPLLFLPPLSRCSSSNTFDAVLPQWPLLPWRLRLPALLKLLATATVWGANYAYGSSYREDICQVDHSSSIVQGVPTRLSSSVTSYNCLWSMISSWRIFVLEAAFRVNSSTHGRLNSTGSMHSINSVELSFPQIWWKIWLPSIYLH